MLQNQFTGNNNPQTNSLFLTLIFFISRRAQRTLPTNDDPRETHTHTHTKGKITFGKLMVNGTVRTAMPLETFFMVPATGFPSNPSCILH